MRNYVVVIGSKPNSTLPDINPVRVYTANSAASLSSKYAGAEKICIAGGNEIKKENVFNAVYSAQPKRLVLRGGGDSVRNVFNDLVIQLEILEWKLQFQYQKKFFSAFYIWFYDFTLMTNLSPKKCLAYLLKFQKKPRPQGVSTGMFAILRALDENPYSTIIVCGIGLMGGGHFDGIGKMSQGRGLVDFKLFKLLSAKHKERILTTDDDFSRLGGVLKFE